jgi:cytochrome c peroxidase
MVRRLLAAAGLIAICAVGALGDEVIPADLKELYRRPLLIPFEGHTVYSPQLATLGKMLFFDPRLSGAQNMACASCHNPSFGWEVPVAGAVGAQNVALGRQAPTVLNAAWKVHMFWDGRAPDLETQAAGPIGAELEMNGNFDEIGKRLSAVPVYKQWFGTLFPKEGIDKASITTAIATYERTVVAGWSPFDRWIEGDEEAISASAKRGFILFNGSAGCSNCHSGWNFTDEKFHDIGLPGNDQGRAKLEPDNPLAAQAFKTPGLRNVMYRAPFMHDGSIADMRAVLKHYESGVLPRPSLATELPPALTLSEAEENDLIEFFKALTADEAEVPTPILPTQQ